MGMRSIISYRYAFNLGWMIKRKLIIKVLFARDQHGYHPRLEGTPQDPLAWPDDVDRGRRVEVHPECRAPLR
jgi:hypothetical protein